MSYLTDADAQALLVAADISRWIGCCDHALLAVAIQARLRASELTGLRCQDIQLGGGAQYTAQAKAASSAAHR